MYNYALKAKLARRSYQKRVQSRVKRAPPPLSCSSSTSGRLTLPPTQLVADPVAFPSPQNQKSMADADWVRIQRKVRLLVFPFPSLFRPVWPFLHTPRPANFSSFILIMRPHFLALWFVYFCETTSFEPANETVTNRQLSAAILVLPDLASGAFRNALRLLDRVNYWKFASCIVSRLGSCLLRAAGRFAELIRCCLTTWSQHPG